MSGILSSMKGSETIDMANPENATSILTTTGMQIEESFWDMKSLLFGEGLERSRSSGAARFKVLVLIASLSAFLLWLLGTAAEAMGLEQRMRPGSRKRRAYSRLFLARLILTLDSCRSPLVEVIASVGAPDQWVANHHDALFSG